MYYYFSVIMIELYRSYSNVKERRLPQFTVYIVVVSPEDGRRVSECQSIYSVVFIG